MTEQYKIELIENPNGGQVGCWVIVDTSAGGKRVDGRVYHTHVDAEARLNELNNNQNYKTIRDDFTVDADDKVTNDLEKVTNDLEEFGGREDIRVVTTALKGKVKCSSCQTAFHETEGALAVDRFIGYNYDNLAVDLRCQVCDHTGIYTFDGNPLIDAGLIERIPEPFGGGSPV